MNNNYHTTTNKPGNRLRSGICGGCGQNEIVFPAFDLKQLFLCTVCLDHIRSAIAAEYTYPEFRRYEFRHGGDAIVYVQPSPEGNVFRVWFKFPPRTGFGYNPICSCLPEPPFTPISRSYMDQVGGCQRFAIDVHAHQYIRLQIGNDIAYFRVVNGQIQQIKNLGQGEFVIALGEGAIE